MARQTLKLLSNNLEKQLIRIRNSNQRGFTLAEVLVSLLIFSIISLALYTIVNQQIIKGVELISNSERIDNEADEILDDIEGTMLNQARGDERIVFDQLSGYEFNYIQNTHKDNSIRKLVKVAYRVSKEGLEKGVIRGNSNVYDWVLIHKEVSSLSIDYNLGDGGLFLGYYRVKLMLAGQVYERVVRGFK